MLPGGDFDNERWLRGEGGRVSGSDGSRGIIFLTGGALLLTGSKCL